MKVWHAAGINDNGYRVCRLDNVSLMTMDDEVRPGVVRPGIDDNGSAVGVGRQGIGEGVACGRYQRQWCICN